MPKRPLRKHQQRLKQMSGASSDFLQIARVLKSNGTEGEVLVGFRDMDPEDLNLKEPVFIEFDGLPVPFFIESFNRRGTSRALMKLTGIKTLQDAEEIAGRPVLAPRSSILDYEDGDEGLTVEDLVGWTLLDEAGSEVGSITGYEDIPGNPCLYVGSGTAQAMVPLHEDLIVAVDEEERKISMIIPEGLL